MFHDLTPDLVDPMLLAEVTIPSLYEVIGLRGGEVTLTFDPTIRKPMRTKSQGFAAYSQTAHRGVEELIERLDDSFEPFRVAFLKANVKKDESMWPLDLMTVVANLHLVYLRAQHCIDLIGETVDVSLSLSLPAAGSGKKARATVDCTLSGEARRDRGMQNALQEYQASVSAVWSRLTKNCLGTWASDNGVTELRLSGQILVDPREAMAAIGQPLQ